MRVYEIVVDENKKEETQHGSYDFPMAVYEDQYDKLLLGYVNWHWHEEIQFMYVTRGSIEVFAGKESFILKEGDGTFINSEVLHKSRPVNRKDCGMICINIHEHLLSGFAGSRLGTKYVLAYLSKSDLDYRTLSRDVEPEKLILDNLRNIYELYKKKGDAWELDLQIEVLKCWRKFIELEPAGRPVTATAADTERLKKIMQIINENYGEKLMLADFSAALNLSAAECCRLFKRQMHCTIFEYLSDIRIEKSFEKLTGTDRTVSEIAFDCGFSSTSYYIKRFKEKTGMTPLEFRKKK